MQELEDIIEEISLLPLEHGLREKLESAVRKLNAGEKLKENSFSFLEALSEGISQIKVLQPKFLEIQKLDEGVRTHGEFLTSATENLKDLEKEISKYAQSLDLDDESLEQKREILAQLAKLERKHRTNDVGLMALLESAKEEKKRLSRPADLKVIKKNGTKEDFSREKLRRGIVKATWKRPVSMSQIDEMIDEVEKKLRIKKSTEVKSWEIGNLIINRLKKRKMGHNKHMLCPTCCTIKAIFIKIE